MGNEATDVTLNRNRGLGGSDEPAIMELSPFKTRWQLLREKAGLEENTFTGNFYTRYGQEMEPLIRDYINKEYCYHFEQDYISQDKEPLSDYYHADGHDSDKMAVLEIKTTSDVLSEWDVVCDYDIDFKEMAFKHYKKYFVQLAKGMWMFDSDEGVLAVYERDDDSEEFDPDRLQIFWVKREEIDPLIGEVLQADEDFRKDYKFLVEHKDATEDMLPSRQALVDISAKQYQLGKQMVSGLFLLSHKKEITDLLDQISADFKTAMEKRGITKVVLPDGTKISYTATAPDKTLEVFDEEAFQKDYPAIYGKYIKLQTKKGRASFVKVQVKKK